MDIPPGKRPPGTLLLNMLTKNEEEHLTRTLPKWAKVIDYWIIGIDDKQNPNDKSVDVIQRNLGHLPGEVVVVHMDPDDGMGKTWSKLVDISIEKYPNATHGIIADADFMPMVDRLDRYELDVRCSKHMYTIWTEDHKNERRMDWIYRNIPGAVVKRRTHQTVEVPELPDQEVFQTMIHLPLEERTGGWGDRSGVKEKRYIRWLELDLIDYPDDPRTLYYLGYAHFDIFNKNKEKPSEEHMSHLHEAIKYFKWRGRINEGNKEELWFALLKLGEIYERFLHQWNEAEIFYRNCSTLDAERADAFFYLGQHYRLHGDIPKALPFLKTAAHLPFPDRALFQWHYLYQCLATLEYARALQSKSDLSADEILDVLPLLKKTECAGGEPTAVGEIKGLIEYFENKKMANKNSKNEKLASVRKLLQFLVKHFDLIEEQIAHSQIQDPHSAEEGRRDAAYKGQWDEDDEEFDHPDKSAQKESLFDLLLKHMEELQLFTKRFKEIKGKDGLTAARAWSTCRQYRLATTPYLRFFKQNSHLINFQMASHSQLMEKWTQLSTRIRGICR